MQGFLEFMVDVADQIDREITNHSNGGCGVVALAAYNNLKNHFPVKLMVHGSCSYYDENGDWVSCRDLSELRQNIGPLRKRDQFENNLFYQHIICAFKYYGKWYFFDPDSLKGVDRLSLKKAHLVRGEMKESELSIAVRIPDVWNPCYNRNQNKKVRQIVSRIGNYLNNQKQVA